MEVGFVHGSGVLGHTGRLDLELLDQTVVPAKGETVVTWGSSKGAPYVAGVPIGVVDSVYSSVRDSTQHARITPMVDFSTSTSSASRCRAAPRATEVSSSRTGG